MLDESYYEIHDGCCDVGVRPNDGECELCVGENVFCDMSK